MTRRVIMGVAWTLFAIFFVLMAICLASEKRS